MSANEITFGGDFAVEAGPPPFRIVFGGNFRVQQTPPPLFIGFGGDFLLDAGTVVLMRLAGQLVERRVKIKIGDRLVDSEPSS